MRFDRCIACTFALAALLFWRHEWSASHQTPIRLQEIRTPSKKELLFSDRIALRVMV